MKKVVLFILSVTFILASCLVTAQTFNKHYGVFEIGWADTAYNIEYANDSLYIIFVDQNPAGGSRLCISNISLLGEENWFKCLNRDFTSRNGGSNSLDANLDNSRYVQGQAFHTVFEGTEDLLYLNELVMFDQNFDTLYTTLVGDSINFYTAKQAKFTPDGGSVMVGWTHTIEPEEGPYNLWLAKFDTDGNEEWQSIHSTFPGSWDTGFSIEALDNGNFIVGSAVSNWWGEPNWQVITLFDSLGNYIHHEEFGNSQFNEGWANVTALSDGNFVYCAAKQVVDEIDNYYIVKFNEELEVEWEKDYYFNSSSVFLSQIKESEDGTLIACGTWEGGTLNEYGAMLKLDSNGDLLWHRRYQHANDGIFMKNKLYDVTTIPDNGGYVACGERNGPDNGQNYWVLKVDNMGCLVEGCDTITSVTEIRQLEDLEIGIYPNPATELLNVFIPELPASLKGNSLSLVLRNIEGKEEERTQIPIGNMTVIMDVREYPRGVYLLSVVHENKELISQKIILE